MCQCFLNSLIDEIFPNSYLYSKIYPLLGSSFPPACLHFQGQGRLKFYTFGPCLLVIHGFSFPERACSRLGCSAGAPVWRWRLEALTQHLETLRHTPPPWTWGHFCRECTLNTAAAPLQTMCPFPSTAFKIFVFVFQQFYHDVS